MTFSLRHLCRAVAVAVVLAAACAAATACDNNCNCCTNNGGSAASYYDSAYFRAYEQWLLWQQKLYEDRKQAMIARQEQMRKDRLDRQLYHPPVTEVWAAEPLNALLVELNKLQVQGTDLPEVELTKEMIAHTNLTSGVSDGNVGLLKNDGKFRWPTALRTAAFAPRREHIEALAAHLVKQARDGDVDLDNVDEAAAMLDKAQDQLRGQVSRLSAPQYIEAKRYLNDLKAAFKVLGQPDASSYFKGDYAAKGKTVAELVQHMTKKGLKFAPAAPADKAAYLALHRALADCALGAANMNKPLIQ